MKHLRAPCAIFLSAIALPTTANAAGITYDCDTAPGHFSELVLPAPANHFRVSGNIKVNQVATHEKWAPMARVRIGSAPPAPGAPLGVYGGLDLTAVPGKAVSVAANAVQLFTFQGSGTQDEPIRASFQPTGTAQPFQLSFDGRSIAVTIGSASRSYPVTIGNPVIQLVCSTGEFLLTDVQIEAAP